MLNFSTPKAIFFYLFQFNSPVNCFHELYLFRQMDQSLPSRRALTLLSLLHRGRVESEAGGSEVCDHVALHWTGKSGISDGFYFLLHQLEPPTEASICRLNSANSGRRLPLIALPALPHQTFSSPQKRFWIKREFRLPFKLQSQIRKEWLKQVTPRQQFKLWRNTAGSPRSTDFLMFFLSRIFFLGCIFSIYCIFWFVLLHRSFEWFLKAVQVMDQLLVQAKWFIMKQTHSVSIT